MGLDKWLKPKEEAKKTKMREKENKNRVSKKITKPKKENHELTVQKPDKKTTKILSKFELICSNSKCKYQKIIMKKLLTEKDKTCPRCSGVMKVKKT